MTHCPTENYESVHFFLIGLLIASVNLLLVKLHICTVYGS